MAFGGFIVPHDSASRGRSQDRHQFEDQLMVFFLNSLERTAETARTTTPEDLERRCE
jgi:hypothetical protein